MHQMKIANIYEPPHGKGKAKRWSAFEVLEYYVKPLMFYIFIYQWQVCLAVGNPDLSQGLDIGTVHMVNLGKGCKIKFPPLASVLVAKVHVFAGGQLPKLGACLLHCATAVGDIAGSEEIPFVAGDIYCRWILGEIGIIPFLDETIAWRYHIEPEMLAPRLYHIIGVNLERIDLSPYCGDLWIAIEMFEHFIDPVLIRCAVAVRKEKKFTLCNFKRLVAGETRRRAIRDLQELDERVFFCQSQMTSTVLSVEPPSTIIHSHESCG